jgi:hypothetical protein
LNQASLILWRKHKHESPCQDTIESSIEKLRILDGFASDGSVWEIASECLDERSCGINAIDAKSFGHQSLGNGNAGPAAKINNSGPAWQRFSPVADPLHPDNRRSSAYKRGCDALISVRSIHHAATISKASSRTCSGFAGSGQLWVTCGRRPGKNFLTFCSIGRVRSRVRPVNAAGVAVGRNALRGSGPNRSHALESALTQTGSPDPRNDRICITSSCPRQFVETPVLCCWQQSWLPERLCADHHGPGHARDFIGKRNGGDLNRPAFHYTGKPEPPRAVLPRISDNGHGACNEQPSQIPISLL